MSDITHILNAIDAGDLRAAEGLLPLVYDELRRLAAQKLAHEKPGQTLQPTALVHEAYIRLVASVEPSGRRVDESETTSGLRLDARQEFSSRGHFFAAAAEAMRRILIDRAREKAAEKRGGGRRRLPLEAIDEPTTAAPDELLLLDEALELLTRLDPTAGQLVKLRYYAGLSVEQAASALNIAVATAYRHWTFARAWLHRQVADGHPLEASQHDLSKDQDEPQRHRGTEKKS